MSQPVRGRGLRAAGFLSGCQPKDSFQGPEARALEIVLERCVRRGHTCVPGWAWTLASFIPSGIPWVRAAGCGAGGQAGAVSGNGSGGNDPDACVTLGPWTGAGGKRELCILPVCPRSGPSRTAPGHPLWWPRAAGSPRAALSPGRLGGAQQRSVSGPTARRGPSGGTAPRRGCTAGARQLCRPPRGPTTAPGEGPGGRAPLPPRWARGQRRGRRGGAAPSAALAASRRDERAAPGRGQRDELRRRCAASVRGQPQPVGRAALRAAAAPGRRARPGLRAAARPPAPQPGTGTAGLEASGPARQLPSVPTLAALVCPHGEAGKEGGREEGSRCRLGLWARVAGCPGISARLWNCHFSWLSSTCPTAGSAWEPASVSLRELNKQIFRTC